MELDFFSNRPGSAARSEEKWFLSLFRNYVPDMSEADRGFVPGMNPVVDEAAAIFSFIPLLPGLKWVGPSSLKTV
jgi:hypothetical protein